MFEDYLAMPEGGKWILLHNVSSHESAYSLESNWYSSKTRIAVMNVRTKETKIFISAIDKNGNLVGIVELKGDGTLYGANNN